MNENYLENIIRGRSKGISNCSCICSGFPSVAQIILLEPVEGADHHLFLLFSRYVADYCEAHPEAAAAVETELELSKEMVGLLPLKINRLKARMVSNN